MRRIETDIENIRFNKAECGVDFLINTDVGCRLKYYYYGGKVYATDFLRFCSFGSRAAASGSTTDSLK